MDAADLLPLVEDLTSNIDDLEESLAPLLKTALSTTSSKLPLLDKAKLYVLATYAIESILFSCLRLNGVDAKSHLVFLELARVKDYFEKIKAAETAGTKRSAILDKDAASRFIKHGLAGNEKYDRERAGRIAKQGAGSKRKLEDMYVGTHTRFDGAAERIRTVEAEQNGNGSAHEDGASGQERAEASEGRNGADADGSVPAGLNPKNKTPEEQVAKRRRKAERKKAGIDTHDDPLARMQVSSDGAASGSAHDEDVSTSQAVQKAPKSSAEALEALLDVSSPKTEGTKKKKKRKKSKGLKLEDERADEMK